MEKKRTSLVGWSVYSAFVWSILFAIMFTGTGSIDPTTGSSENKTQLTQIN